MSFLDEPNDVSMKSLRERGNELNQVFNNLKLEWVYNSVINGRDTFGRLGALVRSGNRHAIDLDLKLYGFLARIMKTELHGNCRALLSSIRKRS
jgi:hypothetical protein